MKPESLRRIRGRSGLWLLLGAASLCIVLAGCDIDTLLDVDSPDIVPGDVAAHPDNLQSLRNGVLFEFARAFTGPAGSNDYPGIIGTSGVMTDEQWYASTFTQMREIDSRGIPVENGGIVTVFRHVQRARNWAEVTAREFANSPSANSADHALVTNLAGYAHFFLADNFCSGTPLSHTSISGALEFGPGLTTTEMLERALGRFVEARAIAQAAGSAQQLNLARVGEARALLNLGRRGEAATVAAQVPAGFSHRIEYSEVASGQSNGIWAQINSNRRSSLASQEGPNGIRFFDRAGTNAATLTVDPRVPVISRDLGLGNTGVAVFRTGKFATRGANVPLASYVEAQLIVAENLLADGSSAAYLPVLNALRADVASHLPTLGITPPAGASLPALTDPGSREARILQLYQERAFWLHLTGQRLGDLRRLMRLYGFQQNQVFPTGTTVFNTPYQTDVNFPVPFVEGNNPLFAGECFNRLP